MVKKKRRTIEAERQHYYYMIYEMLGPKRTLKKVHNLVTYFGTKISLKTLKRYSYVYNWQAKLLERAAKEEAAPIMDAKQVIEKMKAEHYNVFHDIGQLVKAGIRFHEKEIAKSKQAGLGDVLPIPVTYLGKMADYYQKGELLASGEATSKIEVIYQVMAPVVKEVMAVFLAVNVITNDPPEIVMKRQIEFIKRGDAILKSYYEQTKLLKGG